jgi:hypothetical protein
MRPGRLWKNKAATQLYPNYRDSDGVDTRWLAANTVLLVLSVKPDERISNYYDLRSPWLVLAGDKVGLIETMNLWLEDIGPFPEKTKAG